MTKVSPHGKYVCCNFVVFCYQKLLIIFLSWLCMFANIHNIPWYHLMRWYDMPFNYFKHNCLRCICRYFLSLLSTMSISNIGDGKISFVLYMNSKRQIIFCIWIKLNAHGHTAMQHKMFAFIWIINPCHCSCWKVRIFAFVTNEK